MKSVLAASALLLGLQLSTGVADAAVKVARATAIPACTIFVDAASASGNGSTQAPHKTITAAVEAADSGAIICVAEGIYTEQLSPAEKSFTLAGGFQRGTQFKVRDSAKYVSHAKGKGGSFLRVEDPAPQGKQLTSIDGFEISGYGQAIYRDYYESQRFDITNNFIHDNTCADQSLAGAAFALNNVSGTIRGNVIQNNSCGRGGAGFLNDSKNENSVSIESNFADGNSGTEPGAAHGGGFYFFGNTLNITNNLITNNRVTQWGGGLYVGAFTAGNQPTTATLSRNVYRSNRAGNAGGGFFCDDGATCNASYEIYDSNCGGNVLVDGGSKGSGPTKTRFDHITNTGALGVNCEGPGAGLFVDTYEAVAPDTHAVTNSIFWKNADGGDFGVGCNSDCSQLQVSVTRSMVQSKYSDGSVKIKFGAGNITPADPLFGAPDNGDFSLQAGSPARGKAEGGSDLGAGGTIVAIARKSEAAPPEAKSDGSAAPGPGPANGSLALAAGDAARKSAQQTDDRNSDNEPADVPVQASTPTAGPPQPAVTRGGTYMSFPEKFNRYYTDPSWKPSKTVYVSAGGNGDGTSRNAPMAVKAAVDAARPGTKIHFLRGKYEGCYQFSKETSGSYDDPVVLYAERNDDQSSGVAMTCCSGGQACFNLEAADYIAIDGFEFIGGKYGVRAAGAGYPASEHSRGISVTGCMGHEQNKDPFFTGQSDWNVFERNLAFGAKKGDGHGFYISNGSDWNIVRSNETYGNASSDFQINADPASACEGEGIAFDDPRCDAYAGDGEGGQGASDYFLVENNYFHHGLSNGANFTSVRRSVVRNNIFGPQVRHNVSFWQETNNPKLGSSDNKILHNLFITTGRHGVKFEAQSTRNEFANNLLLGIQVNGDKAAANPSALLMEIDDTVADNVYRNNFYASGKLEGREVAAGETASEDFSPDWFAKFPASAGAGAEGFKPTAKAPFLGQGKFAPDAALDRNGKKRSGAVDPGPIEVP